MAKLTSNKRLKLAATPAKDEPAYRVPPLPKTICKSMKKEYGELMRLLYSRGKIDQGKILLVETLMNAKAMERDLRQVLIDEGFFIQTATGEPKQHPAGTMLTKAESTVMRSSIALGLVSDTRGTANTANGGRKPKEMTPEASPWVAGK